MQRSLHLLPMLITFVLLWLQAPLKAAEPQASFESANTLYDQGKFKEASAAYLQLIQSGVSSPAVHFNLGNALFKSGQLARAVAIYRLLETRTPRDPDLRANLRFALQQVKGPTAKDSLLVEWIRRLTLNQWTLLACAGFWVALLLLAAGQLYPTLQSALRKYALLAGVCTLLTGSSLAISAYHTFEVPKAIALSSDTTIRRGPLEESPAAFTVQEGAELIILDRQNDWLLVSTDPKRVGWIKRDKVLVGS